MTDTLFTRETPPVSAATPRLVPLSGLLDEWDAEALAAHDAYTKGLARGPITGLPKLDEDLGGFLATGVNVLHASPGIGKTALALQIGATCGCPALYLSAEMSALELLRRLTARVTGTFLGKFRTGEIAPDESRKLGRRAAASAPLLTIADASRGAFAGAEWLQQAGEIVRGDAPHLLLVIDSVHSWAEGAPGATVEYDRLGAAIQALRQLGQNLNCSILAIAERNRMSMKTGGMSASAGHRGFEYGAESVIELNRDEDATQDARGEFAVTLKITKNRHGSPSKTIKLSFHGALQRFRETD